VAENSKILLNLVKLMIVALGAINISIVRGRGEGEKGRRGG